MPVAEAMARISEAEFEDWMVWYERRADMQERARKGLPMQDGDDRDDMTPEASAAHVRAIFGQLSPARS